MQQSKWDQERYSQDKPHSSIFKFFLNTPLRYVLGFCLIALSLFGFWCITDPNIETAPVGAIPIIKPLEGPTKIRPTTNPKDTHEDKTIYQKLSDNKDLPKVEHLLGSPEEPMARSLSLPEEFINEFLEEKPDPSLLMPQSSKDPETISTIQDASPQKEITADLPKDTTLDEIKSPTVAVSGSKVKTSTAQNTPSQERYCLQLGTLKTEEHAKLEWKRLSSRHVLKPYLASLKPEFKKVDLGNDVGIRIRLIAGSLTKKEAQNLCQELTKLSVKHHITLSCRVKKR